jgi:hypothetical protein
VGVWEGSTLRTVLQKAGRCVIKDEGDVIGDHGDFGCLSLLLAIVSRTAKGEPVDPGLVDLLHVQVEDASGGPRISCSHESTPYQHRNKCYQLRQNVMDKAVS